MHSRFDYVAAKVKRGRLIHYFDPKYFGASYGPSWAPTWCAAPGWDYLIRDLTPVDTEATCKKCQKMLLEYSTLPVRVMPKAWL